MEIRPLNEIPRDRSEWHLLNENLPHIQVLRGIRSVGVCSMDAAVEPPGMGSRRPSD